MRPEIFILRYDVPIDDEYFNFLLSFSERKDEIFRQKQKKSRDSKLIGEFLAKAATKLCFSVDVKDLSLAYTEFGKPYFKDFPDIHFNVSNSANMVVCAVNSSPVGIDIEKIRKYNPSLSKRVCSLEELECIEKSEDKDLEFTKLWTKKEAYLKFCGTGIQHFKLKDVLDKAKCNFYTKEFSGYIITVAW